MRATKAVPFAVMVLAVLALAGASAGETVSKLSAYGFVARSGDVRFVVDMDLARYRGGEKYIPILIWLGHTERKVLHANPSTFTLTDPGGVKHPMATPEEVRTAYGPNLITSDYTYVGRLPDYGSMVYLACQEIHRVAFVPNPAGSPGVLYDQVELPNRTVFKALAYFQNPSGKASGNYTLTYDDPGSGTRIEVPFAIPWDKGK